MDFVDKLDMMDDDCDIEGFPLDEKAEEAEEAEEAMTPQEAIHILKNSSLQSAFFKESALCAAYIVALEALYHLTEHEMREGGPPDADTQRKA